MLEIYTAGTGNGQRAAIIAEESGLPYQHHKIDLSKGEQKTPEFLALNPAGQIPVLVDTDGPDGKRIVLPQSGAIMLYLAEKSGKLLPKDPVRKAAALQWFMQAASDVSACGGAIFFLSNGGPEKQTVAVEMYENRLIGLLRTVNARLAGRDYLADELSIADLALFPVVRSRMALIDKAGGLDDLKRWVARIGERPGVQRGIQIA